MVKEQMWVSIVENEENKKTKRTKRVEFEKILIQKIHVKFSIGILIEFASLYFTYSCMLLNTETDSVHVFPFRP